MSAPQYEGSVSGLFIEFVDAWGHTVAQALLPGWAPQPLPDVGDTFSCAAQSTSHDRMVRLRGEVVARHFDAQRHDDRAVVWVRLRVRTQASSKTSVPRRRRPVGLSSN